MDEADGRQAVGEGPPAGGPQATAERALAGWAGTERTDAGPNPAAGVSRRRRAALAAAALVAAAAAAVILLASGSSSRRPRGSGLPAGETTALVARRTLSESATVDGTLGYGGERVIYDRLAGTYTWLPAVGAHIARDGTLFRVDNRPVVLLYGSVPAYRTLKGGVSSGPDVAELNANLIDLGYDPYSAISDENSYGEATTAAVRRFQRAEGLPETGAVELGRVVFEPGAQRVTALKVSLGQDPPGAHAAEATSETKSGKSPKKKKTNRPSSKRHEPKKHKPHKAKQPKAADEPSGSSKSPSASKSPGAENSAGSGNEPAAGGGEPALATTATRQIVQLKVKPEQQRLAHRGERVRVLLPGGATVPGHISDVGTVAAASENPSGEGGGGGSEPTITVTVTLDRPAAHLDQAPVSVELVKSIRRNVLTVPATALIATAGGGYAVEVLEDGRRVPVAVTPGMFSGGYVQVEGLGVRDGMTVVESE